MMSRIRLVLAGTAAALALAAGPGIAPPARAEGVQEKVDAFKEYLKTSPDSQGIRNQIAELSLAKDPKVADVLLPMLSNPKYDDDVKIAVCQNVGKQGRKDVAAKLMFLADSKPWEEKPKLIAAALEGVGDSDPVTHYKDLMKIAKKALDYNADIACAGFRAASLNVSADTVDDLIKELGRADTSMQNDNAQKKAARGATKPVLIDLLKKMTGKSIDDVKVWNTWWNENKKTWKPPTPGKEKPKDLNSSDTFSDDAYGFEIKKPNRAWSFRKNEGGGPYLSLESLEEGQRAAWVELSVYGTKNYKDKTPEAWAKANRDQLEGKFRDIKTAEWEKKCAYGGVKGVEQILVGLHKDLESVHMHNVYLEKSEVIYMFICVYKSGKKASLESDIEDILRSFKLTR